MPLAVTPAYAARLSVDYPEHLDRLSTLFRPILIIPIAIILGLITGTGQTVTNTIVLNEAGEVLRTAQNTGGGLVSGLAVATALMILVAQRYPRWWFDFARELTRFGYRVGAYMVLLTDQYPSTVDEQAVHLELDYPEVAQELNRWLPLVKWLLAIPHYVALAVLSIGAIVAVVLAWFTILANGRYPHGLFDYVVGVGRWGLRVNAYTGTRFRLPGIAVYLPAYLFALCASASVSATLSTRACTVHSNRSRNRHTSNVPSRRTP